jgi:hypothetical protein
LHARLLTFARSSADLCTLVWPHPALRCGQAVLVAVNTGLERARDEHNIKDAVVQGLVPPHEYAIIVCAMRYFEHFFSEYYKHFCTVHSHETPERRYGLASVALIASAIACRDSKDLPIVGIDIAGAERGFPARSSLLLLLLLLHLLVAYMFSLCFSTQ